MSTWTPSNSIQDGALMQTGVPVQPTKWVYVGGTGSPTFTTVTGTSLTFVAVPAGTLLPIRVTAMTAAGGASSVLALY